LTRAPSFIGHLGRHPWGQRRRGKILHGRFPQESGHLNGLKGTTCARACGGWHRAASLRARPSKARNKVAPRAATADFKPWQGKSTASFFALAAPAPQVTLASDTLTQYAQKCDAAVGETVPDFDCNAGEAVPEGRDNGKPFGFSRFCDWPNVLNHQCDPGSK